MTTLLLSLVLSPAMDVLLGRGWRALTGVDASKTLWGTTLARAAAWALAYRLTRRRAPAAERLPSER